LEELLGYKSGAETKPEEETLPVKSLATNQVESPSEEPELSHDTSKDLDLDSTHTEWFKIYEEQKTKEKRDWNEMSHAAIYVGNSYVPGLHKYYHQHFIASVGWNVLSPSK
jgi:hypothetical protein